jgi:hypothetical protein
MRRLPLALAAALLAACDGDSWSSGPPGPPVGNARAFGIWAPGPYDNCTAAIHDRYSVVGPDRKLYPTWHPPVDPVTGCAFGHDHGRDPSGSALHGDVGDIPFGYANEQLDVYDPANPRHEDHVGHKVEWENGVRLRFDSPAADALFDIRCDVLVKLHQGTHSKDALTNNLHELAYHVRCTDGTELHLTFLATIGDPGRFTRTCDGATIFVGPATPANSPEGGGQRRIPDRTCVDREILVSAGELSNYGVLHESWELSSSIRSQDGHTLAHINPYFQARLPSRFHDPATTTLVGRPIDVCYEVTPDGRRARGGVCETSTAGWTITGLTYDDPRSLFNGVRRPVDINDNFLSNARGPAIWYTDPFGRNARTQPFPGSIRQFIARIDNDRGGLGSSGPTIGGNRNHGGPTVHAPN